MGKSRTIGLDQRGVGAAGQLAQPAVVDAGAEVVRVADHRRAGGTRDGGLDLLLHRGERALDDLDQHRVHVAAGASARSLVLPALDHEVAVGVHRRPVKPGWSGSVEPYSSMTAGPCDDVAGGEAGAVGGSGRRAAARPRRRRRGRSRARRSSPAARRGRAAMAGRVIGPMPETRRLTHSTRVPRVVAVARSRRASRAPRGTGRAPPPARPRRAGRPGRAPAPRTPGRSSAGRRCARRRAGRGEALAVERLGGLAPPARRRSRAAAARRRGRG